jgi:hypothetical protein
MLVAPNLAAGRWEPQASDATLSHNVITEWHAEPEAGSPEPEALLEQPDLNHLARFDDVGVGRDLDVAVRTRHAGDVA